MSIAKWSAIRALVGGGVVLALALLVPSTATADPIASATAAPGMTAGEIPVWFDASASAPGSSSTTIALYEWDYDNDGVYDWSGTTPYSTYAYRDWDHSSATVRVNTAVLRVTDSVGGYDLTSVAVRQTTDSWSSSYVNQAPVADAGGTYQVEVGDGVTLDGTGSYDPDAGHVDFGDTIMAYTWWRIGVSAPIATGATPYLSPTTNSWLNQAGDYALQLRVTDRWGTYGFSPTGSPYTYPSILVQVRAEGYWGTPVPEPLSAVLVGVGLLGLGARRRARRRIRGS